MTSPRSRQSGLLVRNVGNQVVVYDPKKRRLRVLNQVAATVWRHCDGERTIEDLTQLVSKDLGLPADENIVWIALARLQKADLLETTLEKLESGEGMERRELLLKAAQTVAGIAMLPTVLALSGSEMPVVAAPSRVLICHKGQTIEVDEHALPAHLGHGDTIGPCELPTTIGPPPTTTIAPQPTPAPPPPPPVSGGGGGTGGSTGGGGLP